MRLKQEIKINLTYPLTTSGTIGNETTNLQYEAIDQVEKHLQRFIDQNESFKLTEKAFNTNISSSFILPRQNNTIYINGERGAGKTTFLLDILEKYQVETNVSKKIIPIAFIDPTLVQTNQAILVDIISKMYQKTNEVLVCGKDHEKKSKLNSTLEQMSDGLKLLEFNHNPPPQKDSSWYLEKSLKNSTSGQCLEQRFHGFIDICAEILNANLFILAIDDVDTKTDKAFEVLEVIRRYLTHPKLSILISGDLQLYSHLVKNQKLKEISFEKTENHNNEMVEHLSQQYLVKIFPLEQRIMLKKMTDILDVKVVKIEYLNKDKRIEENIQILLSNFIQQALRISEHHLESYQKFIFNQPIRSILQFFKYILDSSSYSRNNIIVKPDSFKIALYNIFFGSLESENLKLANLISYSPEISTIGYELFKLLKKNNDLETGFYCRPESNLDYIGHAAGQFYLATIISNQLQGSSRKISDIIKIMFVTGASVNIYSTYVEGFLREGINYQSYLTYLGLSRNENMVNLVARFSPIIMHGYTHDSAKKQVGTLAGVIRIPRRKATNFLVSEFEKRVGYSLTESIEVLAKSNHHPYNLENYLALKTILLSAHSATTSTEGRDYISIYSLLASMAELLGARKVGRENEEGVLADNLSKLSTIQSYIYPSFFNTGPIGDDDSSDTESPDIDDFFWRHSDKRQLEEIFNDMISNWISDVSNMDVYSSSLMIGKIWARIFQSCTAVSELALTEKNIITEDLFSRLIWAVINAVLIEECRYTCILDSSYRKSIAKARNTNTSPKELVNNLEAFVQNHYMENIDKLGSQEHKYECVQEYLPITYSLLSCPLLWPFINSSIELKDRSLAQDKKRLSETLKDILSNNFYYQKYLDNRDTNEVVRSLYISSLPIMGTFRK